jgi:hypothetical protein
MRVVAVADAAAARYIGLAAISGLARFRTTICGGIR